MESKQVAEPLFGPAYYQERAGEMMRLAEQTSSDEHRITYLRLAATWNHLAQQIERPGW